MTRRQNLSLCRFCRRTFPSEQSFNAHCKHCVEFKAHKATKRKNVPQGESRVALVPEGELPDVEKEGSKGELVSLVRVEHVPTSVVGITSRPHRYTSAFRPRSQRQRLLVVQIHDGLRTLREECVGHTKLARMLQSIYGQQDAWEELLCEIHELTELTWNLLNGVQPTMDPLTLYEATLSVRTRWMSLRRAHFSHGSEDSQISIETGPQTGVMEEVSLFEQLVGYLKELISLTQP